MTTRNSIILNVYSPASMGGAGHMLAAIEGMERALPGLHLEWAVSKEGQPIAIAQREAWLAEAAGRGKFPLLCNGDENHPVTIVGRHQLASESPGGQPQFQVQAELPLDAAVGAAAAKMLEHVAEGVCAQWGLMAPSPVMEVIADQTGPKRYGPEKPPLGLPALKLPWTIRSPEIPQYLGWLNHWSTTTAQAIGFPDPARDADLLSRARRTATGGWIVQLTAAPLDLENPAHLDALKWAYERFPEIGGRARLQHSPKG